MSKQAYIKSYFKVKSIDDLEIEELKASRASRATTIETAASIKSISTLLMSIIDHCERTS